MKGKNEYKLRNEQFLAELRNDASVKELGKGVLYRVLSEGSGSTLPKINSDLESNLSLSFTDHVASAKPLDFNFLSQFSDP